MAEKIATRAAYGEALVALAGSGEDLAEDIVRSNVNQCNRP